MANTREAVKKTVETATGKEFKTDYFNPSSSLGRLTMRILESSMAEVAVVFADPAETVKLTHAGKTVEGYTKLIYISPEGTNIRVALRKE